MVRENAMRGVPRGGHWLPIAGLVVVSALGGCASGGDGGGGARCAQGQTQLCSCPGGASAPSSVSCGADGAFPVCPPCGAASSIMAAGGSVAPGVTGQGGTTGSTGAAGTPVTPTMTGPMPAAGMGGAGATPMAGAGGAAMAGAGGSMAMAGSGGTTAGMAGSTGGMTDGEYEEVRQICVDHINMYRATLMLEPMTRASPEQEACSDKGAQMDGDSGQAHGSAMAGLCASVGLFAENTCPGWPIGGFSGFATLADALKGCLDQMWAEGEPPVSRQECQADYVGCFLKHGHYLNMSDPTNRVASCGFYKMKSGAYWMNQDFAFR